MPISDFEKHWKELENAKPNPVYEEAGRGIVRMLEALDALPRISDFIELWKEEERKDKQNEGKSTCDGE